MLTGEKRLGLERVALFSQELQLPAQILVYRLSFRGQLEKCFHVLHVARQRFSRLDLALNAAPLLQNRLSFFLRLPEIRSCDDFF
jgi:hypothetical protein